MEAVCADGTEDSCKCGLLLPVSKSLAGEPCYAERLGICGGAKPHLQPLILCLAETTIEENRAGNNYLRLGGTYTRTVSIIP